MLLLLFVLACFNRSHFSVCCSAWECHWWLFLILDRVFQSENLKHLQDTKKEILGWRARQGGFFFLSHLLHSIDYLVSQKNTAEKSFKRYKVKFRSILHRVENPTKMSQRYQWKFSYTYPQNFFHGFPCIPMEYIVQYIPSDFLSSV